MEDAPVEDMLELDFRSAISRVFEEIVETRRTVAGVFISPETSLQCSAVLACVRLYAETIGSLPFHVYRRLPNNKGKVIAEDHALYNVLAYDPNGWQTSYEFRELMQAWMLLWGNAYAYIVPGRRGSVTELHPLHPAHMVCKRLPGKGKLRTGGKLRYEYTFPGDSTPTIYNQDEIFHLRWLSSDGVTGYVPTTLSRDAIALARATELESSAYFGNGARPGTVIETDQPLKPETAQRLRQAWEDMHRGPERGSRTAVLPHGAHIKELSRNNQTSQLVETRRYQVEEITRAYRVPPYMVGDVSKASYNSFEQQGLDFLTFSLTPHLRRWEGACRRDLVTDDETFFVGFDTSALIAADHAAMGAFCREMQNIGVYSVNDVRSKIGDNPIGEEGDKRFVQVNMQLLEAFTPLTPNGQAPEPAPPAAAPDAPTPPETQPQEPAKEPATSGRDANQVLFKSTLRRLSAIESDGILERRNKPAKLAAFFDEHRSRIVNELSDAAEATGQHIETFADEWIKRSKDLLLECHRSGTKYEVALEGWCQKHLETDAPAT